MATSKPLSDVLPSTIVCDAGPLIHLDELACLELLIDFDRILVPSQVWQEIERHRIDALTRPSIRLQQTDVQIDQSPIFQSLLHTFALDLGEQAALSLMAFHTTAIFLTDDAAARLTAQALGYRVHGTIGILLRAIRRNQRTPTEIIQILRNIPSLSTLYIRQSLLNEIIAEVLAQNL